MKLLRLAAHQWINIINIFICLYFIRETLAACSDCQPGSTDSCSDSTCKCKPHITGVQCQTTEPSYFIPDLDYFKFFPKEGSCSLKVATREELLAGFSEIQSVCNGTIANNAHVRFDTIKRLNQSTDVSLHRVVVRHVYNGQYTALPAAIQITPSGSAANQQCNLSPDQGQTLSIVFRKDESSLYATHSFSKLCHYLIDLRITLPEQHNLTLVLDSLVILPSLSDYSVYKNANAADKNKYLDCLNEYSRISTSSARSAVCRKLAFSVMAEILNEAVECNCSALGAESTTCDSIGGQCQCKPGVTGRVCDHCLPGFHDLSSSGCEECPDNECPLRFSPAVVVGFITVLLISGIAMFSLFLIMFLPTSKYGRLCACIEGDAAELDPGRNKQGTSTTTVDGLKIQRTGSVRGIQYNNPAMTSSPELIRKDEFAHLNLNKKRDSIRSIGPFSPSKMGQGRLKGYGGRSKDSGSGSAPKPTARMGSGLGAAGM